MSPGQRRDEYSRVGYDGIDGKFYQAPVGETDRSTIGKHMAGH